MHVLVVFREVPFSHRLESVSFMQEESFTPRDAQVIELPDDEEKARLAKDPILRMEREKERLGSLTESKAQVAQLVEFSKARGANGADGKWNRELKRDMRVRRREEKALDMKRQEMGSSSDVKLLPETETDIAAATAAMARRRHPAVALASRKQAILSQDIFASSKKPSSKKRLSAGKMISKTGNREVRRISSTKHDRHNVHRSR